MSSISICINATSAGKSERIAGTGITVSSEAEVPQSRKTGNGNPLLLIADMPICRYADDFVLIVKGTKAQAEAIREECRGVLEDSLKLRLNMDKTRITHVNDGFIFWGTGSSANAVVTVI